MGLLLLVSLCGTPSFAQASESSKPLSADKARNRLRYGYAIEAYSVWHKLDYVAKCNIAYGVVAGREAFAEYAMYWFSKDIHIELERVLPSSISTVDLVRLVDTVYELVRFQDIPFADIMINCQEWIKYLEVNYGYK